MASPPGFDPIINKVPFVPDLTPTNCLINEDALPESNPTATTVAPPRPTLPVVPASTTPFWRRVANYGLEQTGVFAVVGYASSVKNYVSSSVSSVGTSISKTYSKWKFTEANWGPIESYIPPVITNFAIGHFSTRVKTALTQSMEENKKVILQSLTDPENFNESLDIVIDYATAFISARKEEVNKALGGQGRFEILKLDQEVEFKRGMMLRIFMGSIPEDGKKITSEELLSKGLINFIHSLLTLYREVELELAIIDQDVRSKSKNDDPTINERINKRQKERIREISEGFLTKFFPGKSADMGSWFSTSILIRGTIWSKLVDKLSEGLQFFHSSMQPKAGDILPSDALLLSKEENKAKTQTFVNKASAYAMCIVKDKMKDSATVNDILIALKPIINSPKFRAEHPAALLNVFKNIAESNDPKARLIMSQGAVLMQDLLKIIINNTAKRKDPVTLEPKNKPGQSKSVAQRVPEMGNAKWKASEIAGLPLLASILGKGLLLLGGDLYDLMSNIQKKLPHNDLNHPMKVIKEESDKFLCKLFPNKEKDFPIWMRFFLGLKGWSFVEEQFSELVLKYYAPIHQVPKIFREYQEKLTEKLHDPCKPEAAPAIVQRAINVTQAFADEIYKGIIESLTTHEPGEYEFDKIERLLQKLNPAFREAGFPDSHPKEILLAIKHILISKDHRAEKIHKTLRTFLGQLLFKCGVNLICNADPENKLPKDLLVANGLKHLAAILSVNEDLTKLHTHVTKFEVKVTDDRLEEREQKRKDLIFSMSPESPKLVNNLKNALFRMHKSRDEAESSIHRYDLATHIPLPPDMQGKVAKTIEEEVLPDVTLQSYFESTRWMRELDDNVQYLNEYVKEGSEEKKNFGKRVQANCTVLTKLVMALVPNILETESSAIANDVCTALMPSLPGVDQNELAEFIKKTLQSLGDPTDPVIKATQEGLEKYIYAFLIKIYVELLREVELIDRSPSVQDVTTSPLIDLVNLAVSELQNYILPLNEALVRYNKKRIFSKLDHISQLPPHIVHETLKNHQVTREKISPDDNGNLVKGRVREQYIHPSQDVRLDATAAEKLAANEKFLYKPMAKSVVELGNFDKQKMLPIPEPVEKVMWKIGTEKGLPKFMEWFMKTINQNSTKIGIIYSIIKKFEAELNQQHPMKAAGAQPAPVTPPSTTQSHPNLNVLLSSKNKEDLRKLVKEIIRLAPENLLNFAYKHFDGVKTDINEKVEEAFVEFLGKFTLVDILDIVITGLTESIHPGAWDASKSKYNPEKNVYVFDLPRTPEQIAARNAEKAAKNAAEEADARLKLETIIEEGVKFVRMREVDGKIVSFGSWIKSKLKDRFWGIGNVIIKCLEFFYNVVIKEFCGWLFGKPLSWVARFFDWIFVQYIKKQLDPQMDIVKMPAFDNLINNFATGTLDILKYHKQEQAKKAGAKAEQIKAERFAALKKREEELTRKPLPKVPPVVQLNNASVHSAPPPSVSGAPIISADS